MKTNREMQSTPLKSSRELAAMLKQLPREERLRVEGIIIGVGLRCSEPLAAARDSA